MGAWARSRWLWVSPPHRRDTAHHRRRAPPYHLNTLGHPRCTRAPARPMLAINAICTSALQQFEADLAGCTQSSRKQGQSQVFFDPLICIDDTDSPLTVAGVLFGIIWACSGSSSHVDALLPHGACYLAEARPSSHREQGRVSTSLIGGSTCSRVHMRSASASSTRSTS